MRFEHKHLDQFHHRSQTAVTRVAIGNDGTQIVDGHCGGALILRHARALFALLARMKNLSEKELLHLQWHCGIRIVCEIGARLIGCGSGRRALPPAYID